MSKYIRIFFFTFLSSAAVAIVAGIEQESLDQHSPLFPLLHTNMEDMERVKADEDIFKYLLDVELQVNILLLYDV